VPKGGLEPLYFFAWVIAEMQRAGQDWFLPRAPHFSFILKGTQPEVNMDSKLGLSTDKGLTGQVVNVEGLVSYQEGSVVSKTLVNKKVGTVTLFAFDKGRG